MEETMAALKFSEFLAENGIARDGAPNWFKRRIDIREAFPSPYREVQDSLASIVSEAIKKKRQCIEA